MEQRGLLRSCGMPACCSELPLRLGVETYPRQICCEEVASNVKCAEITGNTSNTVDWQEDEAISSHLVAASGINSAALSEEGRFCCLRA